ncbi:MAG: hypothetical protein ACM3KE_00555 [Hyphomicrobiales bacterium]
MMIKHKKEFTVGLGMLVSFFVVLVIIFSPVFGGHNGLEYLDRLYNSIAKGSAYYIPKVREDIKQMGESPVDMTLTMDSAAQAQQTAPLFMQAGALVNVSEAKLRVNGSLEKMLNACLDDADAMYHNDGKKLADKYGYNERQALYNWWKAFKSGEKVLLDTKKFKEAKVIVQLNQKALETAYNFYQIEPQKILDRLGVVVFSLAFYVVYTMWYGFAILFMFEGWGMQLEH